MAYMHVPIEVVTCNKLHSCRVTFNDNDCILPLSIHNNLGKPFHLTNSDVKDVISYVLMGVTNMGVVSFLMEFAKKHLVLTREDLRALSRTSGHDTVPTELCNLLTSMHDFRWNDLWFDLLMYDRDSDYDFDSAIASDIRQLCEKMERGMASRKRTREKGMMLFFHDIDFLCL